MLIQLHIKYKKREKSTAQAHFILVLLVKLPCIPGSIPAQILVVHELPGVVSSDLCPLVKRPIVHPVSETPTTSTTSIPNGLTWPEEGFVEKVDLKDELHCSSKNRK